MKTLVSTTSTVPLISSSLMWAYILFRRRARLMILGSSASYLAFPSSTALSISSFRPGANSSAQSRHVEESGDGESTIIGVEEFGGIECCRDGMCPHSETPEHRCVVEDVRIDVVQPIEDSKMHFSLMSLVE